MRANGWGPVALLALVFAPCACAPSVKSAGAQAASGATPAAVETSLEKLEDPRTRARIAALMATPEMQQAVRELVASVSQGALQGLSSDEMAGYTDKLVGQFSHALALAIARDFGAATDGLVRHSVDTALDEATSGAARAKMERLAAAVTSSVMRSAASTLPESVGPALQKALVDEMGPALRDVMQRDVAPGMAAMIRSPDFQAALSDTTRQVAREAVLGSNEGLAELSEKRKREQGGMPLGAVGAFFAARTWLLVLLIAAAVFSIPITWLWRERVAARRYRDDAERRNARAAALLGAMEASDQGVPPSRLLQMLREQLLAETTQAPAPAEPPMGRPPPSRPRHA